ncbi:MAG TPA: cysteine desulfurase [Candidatus Cloacimonetes bacterium]|nr:cysteine desulfurase [Candidatus Cloacimonadota bacterium]
MKNVIYFDGNATTPLDERVLEVMLPYLKDCFGNSASIDHVYGIEAKRAVDNARECISDIIKTSPSEIIFTSGATESNNLAIQGIMKANAEKGKHLITSVTEHPAVLETFKMMEANGYEATYVPVDQYGVIDLDMLKKSVRPDTVMVSIMAANNEIGTLAPLKEIGSITREAGVIFHTDAAQAVGHVPIDVQSMKIDCMSISGHKCCGPKGIGALYIRKSNPRVKLLPSVFGGGHERGYRSGTLNVPGIVGLGKAIQISKKEMAFEAKRFTQWRKYLLSYFSENDIVVELNGHPNNRIPHNISIYIPGIENKALLNRLKEFALSAGSACSTLEAAESHVVKALHLQERRSFNTIRIGFTRLNTKSEVEHLAKHIAEEVKGIRNIFG